MPLHKRALLECLGAMLLALGTIGAAAPANALPHDEGPVSAPSGPCGGPSRIDYSAYSRVQPAGYVIYYGEAHNCTSSTVRIRLTWSVPVWANPNGPCTSVAPGGWLSGSSVQYPARSWNWC